MARNIGRAAISKFIKASQKSMKSSSNKSNTPNASQTGCIIPLIIPILILVYVLLSI